MIAMKRVEIVVDADELSTVCTILDRAGVSGYTVIPQVTGNGDRGDRSRDDLAEPLKNRYVFTACTEPQARAIADAVRGILRRVGGVCLITDCVWVEH